MSKLGDELLAVVSIRKQLSWKSFRDSFNELHLRAMSSGASLSNDIGLVRWRSLRLLSDLAHAETPGYGSSTAIAASPTLLSRLPCPGLPQVVLTGSRGHMAERYLREICKHFGEDARVSAREQPNCAGYAPRALIVEATDESVLRTVAERSGIPLLERPPAWRILDSTSGISDYELTLDWNDDLEPSWPRRDFDLDWLAFRFKQQPDSTRLSKYSDPTTPRQLHVLVRDGRVAIDNRGPDWARWWYLREMGANVLVNDPDAQMIGVPATASLPTPLARALALFSGSAPARGPHPLNASQQIDLYRCIPEEAAEVVAEKLGQTLHQLPLLAR